MFYDVPSAVVKLFSSSAVAVPNVCHHNRKFVQLCLILSQLNAIHTFTTDFLEIRYNFAHFYACKLSLLIRFSNNNSVFASCFPELC